MRRREFVGLVGVTMAVPFASHAQQRLRRIGVLTNLPEHQPEGQATLEAFRRGLQELGWHEGRNLQIDVRWGSGDAARYRQYADELVRLAPDAILAATTAPVAALQRASSSVPIVFVALIDPVGANVIKSMARPGGNATGFTLFEYAIAAKWLELLKDIVPQLTRAAILRDPAVASGIGQFAAIQAIAPTGLELRAINLSSELESAIAEFAGMPNAGLIVTAGAFGANNPDKIAEIATKYRLPAVYPFRYFVRAGGLVSYGPDTVDPYRRAAGYIDRVLKGEKPQEMPVQAPTRFDLVVNLKAAKALSLTVPPTLLARADEVIE